MHFYLLLFITIYLLMRATKVVAKLRVSEADLLAENIDLKGQVEIMRTAQQRHGQQVAELERTISALRDEAAKFSGHMNLKQKIHQHLNIKKENEQLQQVG